MISVFITALDWTEKYRSYKVFQKTIFPIFFEYSNIYYWKSFRYSKSSYSPTFICSCKMLCLASNNYSANFNNSQISGTHGNKIFQWKHLWFFFHVNVNKLTFTVQSLMLIQAPTQNPLNSPWTTLIWFYNHKFQ